MNNSTKNERAVYDRQMIRKILRNQLKTNKIRDVFHNKDLVEEIIETA